MLFAREVRIVLRSWSKSTLFGNTLCTVFVVSLKCWMLDVSHYLAFTAISCVDVYHFKDNLDTKRLFTCIKLVTPECVLNSATDDTLLTAVLWLIHYEARTPMHSCHCVFTALFFFLDQFWSEFSPINQLISIPTDRKMASFFHVLTTLRANVIIGQTFRGNSSKFNLAHILRLGRP